MKDTTEFVVLILFGFFVGVIVSLVTMSLFIIDPMKREAVENGYAHWLVINNATGETKFIWNKL